MGSEKEVNFVLSKGSISVCLSMDPVMSKLLSTSRSCGFKGYHAFGGSTVLVLILNFN